MGGAVNGEVQAGRDWRAAAAVLVAALALTAAALPPGQSAAGTPAGSEPEQTPPNVVVLMTDDQEAASVSAMAQLNAKLAERGLTFSNSFASYPLCCPSRATFLTGQYAHNHGVLDNQAPGGGFGKLDSSRTLAVWLQQAGYYTAHIGKYLNGYEGVPETIPAGWTEWRGSTRTYRFYGYQLNEQGTLVDYGSEVADYQTDVYMAKAVELIARQAPSEQPFFLSVAPLAPHSGGPNTNPQPPADCGDTAKPAPRHATAFDAAPLPQPPSFNEQDVSDKPAHLREREPMAAEDIATVTEDYRCRLESLLAVDEGIEAIVAALRDSGELDDTYIIFTSDNGFFQGEHRIQRGKLQLYEESIRVPLVIRGPGIPKGRTSRELVVNSDLAPTILDLAGAEADRVIDGRSLLPLAEDPARETGREILLQASRPVMPDYEAIRTQRYVYAEYETGERELYDLERDPYQLDSRHADPRYQEIESRLARRLSALRSCSGASCRKTPNLKLKLDFRRGPTGPCARSPIEASLQGPAADDLALVALEVAGELVRTDRRPPFGGRLPSDRFRPRGKSEVRAVATLIDGRRLTLERRLRVCG
jgi:N-acetylglucosamine-6-sulfatase